MKNLFALLLLLAVLLLARVSRAQVGVGTTTPNAKSALDIQSPAGNTGLLIPRLTATQRTGISSPPQGLIVYQTDGTASGGAQTGFWYYTGTGGWVFLDPASGSGLTLPYSGSYGGAATNALDISHTNGGVALRGAAPNTGIGVYGSSSTGSGVYGAASGSGGYGVRGASTAANSAGVFGTGAGANTYGVIGSGETGVQGQGGSGPGLSAVSTNGPALLAEKSGGTTGRVAQLTNTGSDSTAVYVSSTGARPALRAVNTNTSAQAAIRGVKQATAADGAGVEGIVSSGASGSAAGVRGLDLSTSTGTAGVLGRTAGGYGVRGRATASGGYGVSGEATDSYGVRGLSDSGVGVYGSSSNNSPTTAALVGANTNPGSGAVGVLGTSDAGYGVRGSATGSGGYGVEGEATSGRGVNGNATTGTGVFGTATSGTGVVGISSSAAGVQGTSSISSIATGGVVGINSAGSGSVGVLGLTSTGYGVRGAASGSGGYGVAGVATDSYGVFGASTSGSGVYGQTAASNAGGNAGVEGRSTNSAGVGVLGTTSTGTGVRGEATGSSGRAGFFTQTNGSNTAPAVEIAQAGPGPALKLTGEVTTASTGPAGMLPAAYGCVSSAGARLSGTTNWTVTQLSQGYYRITFTSPDLAGQYLLDKPIQVTPYGFVWSSVPILYSASVARYVYPNDNPITTPAGSIDVVVTWAKDGDSEIRQGTNNAGIPMRLHQFINFSFLIYNP